MKKNLTKALLKDNYIELTSASVNIENCGRFCLVTIHGEVAEINIKEVKKLIKNRKLAVIAI